MRQLAGELQPGAGRVARAHDRDHRPHQRLDRAADAEQWRGIVERREPWRIAGFAGRDQADIKSFAGGEFGARIVLAADTPLTCRAAASRQIGQPRQRGPRAVEMVQQRTKRARPDIVGPDQPQPVDPLGVGEVCRAGDVAVVHEVSCGSQHGSTRGRGEGGEPPGPSCNNHPCRFPGPEDTAPSRKNRTRSNRPPAV
jgi:hypothetical protein